MSLIGITQAGSPVSRTSTLLVDNFFFSRADRSIATQIVPHLGLMTLATVLRNNGQSVSIQDPKILFASGHWTEPDHDFFETWAENLLQADADVIGFTAYGRSLPHVVRVAELVKRLRPEQKIILGGPHPTIVGEKLMDRLPYFAAVARYECEGIITPLVTQLARGNDLGSIPNLIIRRGAGTAVTPRDPGVPEMDSLPWPALDLYPVNRLHLTELSIEAGRGCPYECTFCSTSHFFQRRYRLKSNARMLHEMETLRARYGITMFNLNHDLFGLVKSSLLEFCSMAAGRGFEWKCSVRPDTLSPEMVRILAGAGCRSLYLGIETGSPHLQTIIRKRLNLDRSKSIVRTIVGENLHCAASFITGFPEETAEDQDLTLDMIGDLIAIEPQRVHAQLHVLSPEPGSVLAADGGSIRFDGTGPEVDEYIDRDLIAADPDLYSVFYHYDSLTPRWRVLLASAFVTHLIPEVGPALTAHICARFFNRSLSRLFHAVVCAEEPDSMEFEAVMRSLRRGLRRVIDRVTIEAPYLRDLLRLSGIMSHARSTPGWEADAVWLTKFDHNVQALAQAILDRPAGAIAARLTQRGERWCVLRCALPGSLTIGELPSDVGRYLNRRAKADCGAEGIGSGSLPELGLKRIEL
jgi:radical SAM superfamily enzyme YgiQ (UPF0313 family)